jgi:uncharacterized damage-inducible protein DinB
VLERTPRVLRTMLAGLDGGWTGAGYGAGTFSAYNVVGHLIAGEKHDWIPRARLIVTRGTASAFEPFAHGATEGVLGGAGVRPLEALLDEFAMLRRTNIDAMTSMNLTPEKLALRGRHPALGEVTLAQLIATWAVHDIHHTAQIARAMAWQWREEVGPWREYLNILTPKGSGG